jgi:hypothetical protein
MTFFQVALILLIIARLLKSEDPPNDTNIWRND